MEPADVAVTSWRIAFGTALLARAGAAHVLEVASATGDGRAAPTVVERLVRDATGGATVVTRAVVRAVPGFARRRVERRVAAARADLAVEQERSVAVAAAALEVAARFGTDWIVERLDVNRIVERLRLDEIIANLELTDVIVSSTGGVTGHVLDNARTRGAGADALVDRVLHRGRARKVPRDGGTDTVTVVAPAGV